jgi:hypothetical protein
MSAGTGRWVELSRWEREAMRRQELALQKCNQRPKPAARLPSRPCAGKRSNFVGSAGRRLNEFPCLQCGLRRKRRQTNPGNASPATRCSCAEDAPLQPEMVLPTTDCRRGDQRAAIHELNGAGVWGQRPRRIGKKCATSSLVTFPCLTHAFDLARFSTNAVIDGDGTIRNDTDSRARSLNAITKRAIAVTIGTRPK